MRFSRTLLALSSILSLKAAPAPPPMSIIHRSEKNAATGAGHFVRVADAPLLFTPQVFSADPQAEARADTLGALAALERVLVAGGSDFTRVVRLHAYVAREEAVAIVEAVVAARFAAALPAFTLVRTPLTAPRAIVAFEAVAVTDDAASTAAVARWGAAILPAGGKIFISGQAEKGTDLASAVSLTMAGLHRSVAHLGLKKTDIVQVRAFITPFADHLAARRAVLASVEGAEAPPLSLVEWVSDLYAEIEIVVSARALANFREPITYDWFPWLTKSPRYCHIATVAAGTPLVFISAITSASERGPREQMKLIFEGLGSALFEAGSSYRNLAKATYYLADPAARSVLGDIRGVYFDPMRPPAASALGVKSLGHAGRAASVEIVAVPVK